MILNIGWFSTGRDEAARDLLKVTLDNIANGNIKGKIIFTFCNREIGESIESDEFVNLVKQNNIPVVTLSSQQYLNNHQLGNNERRRILYDRQVMSKITDYNPDICVLAGYMLIVGTEMCDSYQMINLHPALPNGPKGSWQEVIWNLIKNKADTSGVMMHLVTPELDRGPVISYCKYPIKGGVFNEYWVEIVDREISDIRRLDGNTNKLFLLIRKAGLSREFPLIILTLKSLCDKDIIISNKKVYDRSGEIKDGYDLTEKVDKILKIL